MHPITLFILLLALTHSISTIISLHTLKRSAKLQRNKINLWLLVHGIGFNLTAYTFNYDLHQTIHAPFALLPVPIIALIQILSAFVLIMYLYIWMMNTFTIMSAQRWIIPLLVTGLIVTITANLLLYNKVPYYQLQLITMIMISFISLLSAYSILPAMKQVQEKEINTVRLIKFRWSMIAQTSGIVSMMLILGDAIWKLTQGINIVYTPVYIIAEFFRQGMVITLLVINSGRYLTWFYYPAKVLQYRNLIKLNNYIARHKIFQNYDFEIDLPPPLPQHIDLLILRQYIVILDTYTFLPHDAQLRRDIHNINVPGTDYNDNIKMLNKISGEYI